MARYWIFLNGKVEGPYGVEQLIRMRGFSRQSQVCVEDASGQPQHWISPADIPDLAHIFKAIDDQRAEPPTPSKPVVKKPVHVPRPYTPAVVVRQAPGMSASKKGWLLLLAILVASAAAGGLYRKRMLDRELELTAVRSLVENLRLPASSPYSTILQMINEKGLKPRWEHEKKEEGLYQTSVSWYVSETPGKSPTLTVYAFEVNSPAQTVRAVNSAAARLLSEGFSAPHPKKSDASAKSTESKKKETPKVDDVLDSHLESLRSGDFQAVWDSFSKRKKAEMARGGISKDGFLRLQALTRKVEGSGQYTLVKSKKESPTETLVLIKQTPTGRGEIFLKQLWIMEDGQWKLDDEQKRSSSPAAESVAEPSTSSSPNTPASNTSAAPAVVPRAALPGMSN